MTQLRSFRDSISNYFDRLLAGIGKRGSSFTDVDAITHDRDTHRFLVQEFKREGESISAGQHWMLRDLAALPDHFAVWHVVKRYDEQIGFAVYGASLETISVLEYQRRFTMWWRNEPIPSHVPAPERPSDDEPVVWPTVDEIFNRTAPVLARVFREPGEEG